MKVRAGTSGYSYKEWKGLFYPDKLSNDRMLAYYATQLDTVEINNTFYKMPRASMLGTWCERVPDGFTFVLKASRRITHIGRLEKASVEQPTAYLFEQAEILGDKLGPVLFQLPPTMRRDDERLDEFLALLPKNRRAAMEFRHPSWFDEAVFERLRAHDVALCFADGEVKDVTDLVSTAGWGYLRLRQVDYADEALSVWVQRVLREPWSEAFVFFKHEDEAAGPRMARRFNELVEQAT